LVQRKGSHWLAGAGRYCQTLDSDSNPEYCRPPPLGKTRRIIAITALALNECTAPERTASIQLFEEFRFAAMRVVGFPYCIRPGCRGSIAGHDKPNATQGR